MKNAETLLNHHLSSFLNNDIEAVMSDYTNDSVLITQTETYKGLVEIRTFFNDLIRYFPIQMSSLELDKMAINDELIFIVWHGKTPSLEVPIGSDTFIIKDGKIRQQTFVGQLNFIMELA